MPEIQAPELSLRLAKAFNVYGPATIRALEEVVFPVVIVDDVRSGGKRVLAMGSVLQPAGGAGVPTRILFTNPLGGPKRIEIRQIVAWTSAIDNMECRTHAPLTTVGVASWVMDVDGHPDAKGLLLGEAVLGAGDIFATFRLNTVPTSPASTEALVGLTLFPGQGLCFNPFTLNTALNLTLVWTEEST